MLQDTTTRSSLDDGSFGIKTLTRNPIIFYILLCWEIGLKGFEFFKTISAKKPRCKHCMMTLSFPLLCMLGSLGNHFLLSNDVVIERPTIGLDWHPLSIFFFFSQQIKLSGMCCLISAVLCVVVTVSTTVIHMNRLQTLRECLYQGSTKTCTCFAGIIDPTLSHHEG